MVTIPSTIPDNQSTATHRGCNTTNQLHYYSTPNKHNYLCEDQGYSSSAKRRLKHTRFALFKISLAVGIEHLTSDKISFSDILQDVITESP